MPLFVVYGGRRVSPTNDKSPRTLDAFIVKVEDLTKRRDISIQNDDLLSTV